MTLAINLREYSLGELFDLSNGINAEKSAYGSGTPFINVLEVISNESLTEKDIPGLVELPPKVLARYRVERGDILLNRTSETQDEVGLASVYLGDRPVVFGGFVFRGKPKTSKLDINYAKYAMRSVEVRDQITSRGQGGIRANIGQRDLKMVTVHLPELPEQRTVASALDDVSALVSALANVIAKKRAIKQGMMQELLTGRRRLIGFSGEWRETSFGDVVHIQRGSLLTRAQAGKGDVPVVAGGKAPAGFTDRANRAGRTITISASGASAGYVRMYEAPIFASDCSTVSDAASYDLDFIYFSLVLRQDAIYRAQTGGAQPHIHARDVYPIRLSIPPTVDEQRAVGRVLRAVNAEIEVLERRLEATRAIKQGMMQELLTGRTRLPVKEDAA